MIDSIGESTIESLMLAVECCRSGKYRLFPFLSNPAEMVRQMKIEQKSRFFCNRIEQLTKKMIMHNLDLAPCCVKGLCQFEVE
ncbi:MAG: hypothetical protein ACXQTL_07550 [Methanosarcinales archaeon]